MTRRDTHRAEAAGFSAAWLQQREPFDALARDAAAERLRLEARLADWRPAHSGPLRVIDLGCGTGANLRWLAPRLGGAQQWLVTDHDARLLRRWPACLAAAEWSAQGAASAPLSTPLHVSGAGFRVDIVRRRIDLAQALHRLPWPAAQLVTASALLDLVSNAWLQQLVAATVAVRAALLMTLSVDGRKHWRPADADDGWVATAFAAHQRRDKGFGGPALGAAAGPALVQALRAAGYRVFSARSDWQLDGRASPQALALQRALVDGLAGAACEQQPAATARVRAWQQRRQALAQRSTLRLGHVDVLALPPR